MGEKVQDNGISVGNGDLREEKARLMKKLMVRGEGIEI